MVLLSPAVLVSPLDDDSSCHLKPHTAHSPTSTPNKMAAFIHVYPILVTFCFPSLAVMSFNIGKYIQLY